MGASQQLLSSFGGSSPVQYLDDLSPQPQAVFSLRKKYSTATNSIRVRRSSDNTEQDIGFSGDALDTAALATFVGANSGFVVSFYDQTGNGEHATQATQANQPRIVDAGVYDGQLVFDGSNDSLKITSLTLGTAYLALYTKWEQATNNSVKILVEATTDYFSNPGAFAAYDYSIQGGIVGASRSAAAGARAVAFTNASGQAQWSMLYDRSLSGTNEIKAWRDGVSLTPTSVENVEQDGTFLNNDIYIGARAGSSLFSTMQLETLVLYSADTSVIRASIEAVLS